MNDNLKDGVIVVGGGIGGLATALALKQAGITVTVFEQSNQMEAVGAGLLLAANAVKALTKLGLGQTINKLSVPQLQGGIYDWRGAVLVKTSSEELEKKFGAPTLAVHRADLQSAMLAALKTHNLKLNAKLLSFEQDAQAVTAHFSNDQQVRASLLIGADGIHSNVRTQLFGQSQPRYSGYTAWRGVTHFDHNRLMPGEYWGRGARFGIAPLSDNRVYWFATKNVPAGAGDSPLGRKQEVLQTFQNWAEPIADLIAATETAAILRNDIYDRLPLPHWSKGRITLLGDAAHPMTPNLGQGACQAIEDALILAKCLGQNTDLMLALGQYETSRIERTSAIVKRSWQIGKLGQWTNPLTCWLRNQGLKLMPDNLQLKQLEPVLGYEV